MQLLLNVDVIGIGMHCCVLEVSVSASFNSVCSVLLEADDCVVMLAALMIEDWRRTFLLRISFLHLNYSSFE